MSETTATAPRTTAGRATLTPVLREVGLPLGAYYLLTKGFHVSTLDGLLISSVIPAVRSVWSVVRERRVNVLAGLILGVNLVGAAVSLTTGDARLMIAKDGVVSSAIGLAILVSALIGRPIMSQVVRQMAGRGDARRLAAWDRLHAGSASFRRAELGFSLVWGTALLAECAARVVGAYTLPVHTMVWLSTVLLVGALAAAFAAMRPFAARLGRELRAEAGE